MPDSLEYILAPMAGYTDLPFRYACRKYGLHYACTALIDAGALVHGNRENDSILARGADEPYLAVQLLGSIPADLQQAVAMLDKMDFEAVDFNMGCPVRKVSRRGAGAALLQDLDHALECLRILRQGTRKPLSVKTRIISEVDPEPTVRFCLALQSCGIDSLTLHGRLAERIYSGPVAGDIIRAVRAALSIPVCANGGIFSRQDAVALAQATGCTRLMVARGAIGNPWLFRSLCQGQDAAPPTHADVCAQLYEHVEQLRAFYGPERSMILARKTILSYLVGRGYRRSLRAQATSISSWEEFRRFFRCVVSEGPLSPAKNISLGE
ncbi:MAG: tRNA-dihydrouridine synthase family protein [Oligosphaeraceae bacterium]|nr:tRNA-dihydrouridine synthase family protein [Oligosphaeraceae bacterium]